MMAYDPGFTNTASTKSSVTFIDGGKGILRYRGYPIDQLAEHSTHLEVAYLLLKGELPDQSELDDFVHEVTFHTYVPREHHRALLRLPLRCACHGHGHEWRCSALVVLP